MASRRLTDRNLTLSLLASLRVVPLLLALAACSSPGTGPDSGQPAGLRPIPTSDALDVRVGARGEGNTVETEIKGDEAVVTVHSEKGIGGLDLMIAAQRRPSKLTFRLHLKGLEGLTLSYSGADVMAGMTNASDQAHESARIAAGAEAPINADSPYWLPITVAGLDGQPATPVFPLQAGYFEVAAPRDFLEGKSMGLTVNWVDFYR